MRILIVEDEPLIRLELERIVTDAGHEVVGGSATGAEAIRLAEAQRPDMVLMDIALDGDMDGIETARIIHDSLSIRSLFVSAPLSTEQRDSVDITRPFGILLKPVVAEQLRHALEEIARRLGKG
ncbi:MAG TPA: response regulator [Hyphomicrobiaceae bacterium]|nr:response regulator [Hyphomicrobiaceae bacterium]